jgi:3',5'-cyclic-AMP phosphodiesterase
MLNRRGFLRVLPGAAAAASTPDLADAGSSSFSFVHFTDPHLEPELKGDKGTLQCFEAINGVKHDFSIAGGDLVFDINDHGYPRAKMLYDLYGKTRTALDKPVHSVPGNHDLFGLSPKSGIAPSDPMYGKKMYEDRIGQRYSSFDHKGWHFVLLDSVLVTPERGFMGGIEDGQFDWLAADLKGIGSKRPVVIALHIPVVTGFGQYIGVRPESLRTLQFADPARFFDLIAGYKVKAVLQGHTHIREIIDYNGVKYITSGAVCGNWWKGPHRGHPEGFGVITVRGEELSWRYVTYGWKAEQS